MLDHEQHHTVEEPIAFKLTRATVNCDICPIFTTDDIEAMIAMDFKKSENGYACQMDRFKELYIYNPAGTQLVTSDGFGLRIIDMVSGKISTIEEFEETSEIVASMKNLTYTFEISDTQFRKLERIRRIYGSPRKSVALIKEREGTMVGFYIGINRDAIKYNDDRTKKEKLTDLYEEHKSPIAENDKTDRAALWILCDERPSIKKLIGKRSTKDERRSTPLSGTLFDYLKAVTYILKHNKSL